MRCLQRVKSGKFVRLTGFESGLSVTTFHAPILDDFKG